MNNLAVADEGLGDFDNALKYYDQVADLHSSEHMVVTAESRLAGKIHQRHGGGQRQTPEEPDAARRRRRNSRLPNTTCAASTRKTKTNGRRRDSDFLRAYALAPSSAFSLNNRGYVAEMDGDLESAQFFYEKAWKANDAQARVGLATNRFADGQRLITVATDSDGKVDQVAGRIPPAAPRTERARGADAA